MRVEEISAAYGCHLGKQYRQNQGHQKKKQKGTFQGQFLEAMEKRKQKNSVPRSGTPISS